MSLINIILNFSRWSITQWVKLPTRPKNQTCRHTLQYQLTKIMKGMCWQTLRGLQNAGFLYYSLKRSLPPIFDIYLQFLPTHSIHNLRQTLLFKYSDFWWFYGQLKLWANKTMVQCIPTIILYWRLAEHFFGRASTSQDQVELRAVYHPRLSNYSFLAYS